MKISNENHSLGGRGITTYDTDGFTEALRVIERRSLWMWSWKYIRATILFKL